MTRLPSFLSSPVFVNCSVLFLNKINTSYDVLLYMYVPTIRKNPNHWWDGLGKAVREAVEKSGVPEGEIVSIGIDTTCCSVVALDNNVSSAAINSTFSAMCTSNCP